MERGSGFYCYERGVCGILMKSDSCYHGALHRTAFLVCVCMCVSAGRLLCLMFRDNTDRSTLKCCDTKHLFVLK